MESMLNTLLAFIPFIIFILTFKVLIPKIVIQSSIIKNQENYNRFFDVNKIKEYVELCDNEKDKLLELERQNLQLEFKLQKINFLIKHGRNDNFTQQLIEID